MVTVLLEIIIDMNEFDEDILFPVQPASSDDLSPEEAKFLISMMTWSFSRLNSYYHCPYEWKQKYLMGQYGVGSAMAEFGSFCHVIHEKFLKGELGIFDLAMYYEDNYNENVKLPFPPNKYTDLAEKYYNQGLEYFENFSWDTESYELLGVEKEIKYQYQGYNFIGFIDYLIRDKADGKIIIGDHKSTILKTLKNGDISKTDRPHFEEFKKQLLLYSHQIITEYGDGAIKELQWNMFRGGTKLTIPWKREEYEEAMKWAIDTIHLIEQDTLFLPDSSNFFWCHQLCSQRNNACPYKA